MSLLQLKDLLRRIYASADYVERLRLLLEFHDGVRGSASRIANEEIVDVLATAQLDLSYYEPRLERRDDRSLYGDDELDRRVQDILGELERLENT